jgi:hypothetical protein
MALKTLKKSFISLSNLRSGSNDNDNQQIPSTTNTTSHNPSSTPTNILAFRTITTMLAKLQPTQTLAGPSPSRDALSSQARRDVRISDAFAHLAIANNEVVALATEYSPDSMTVMACASSPEDPLEKQLKPELGGRSYIDSTIRFIFTKNPRRDDPPTDPVVTYPNIISTTQPEDIGSRTLREYIDILDGIS